MVSVVSNKGEYWKKVVFGKSNVEAFVSTLGRVMRTCGDVWPIADNGAGYKFIHKHNSRDYLHRLVAKAFIPNPENLPQVNHKDCNKANNAIDNLEWISRSQNILHAHKEGRMKKRTENGQIKVLTVEQVIDLYTSVKRDGGGISAKAKEMGIPRTTASSIINKRSRSDITNRLDLEFNA